MIPEPSPLETTPGGVRPPSDLRVGFDMAGAQTPESRGRGIGRYVDGLVGAFARGLLVRRTVLYFHDDLPVDPSWLREEVGVVIRSTGPLRERRPRLERLVAENPDGLDALVVTSPLEPLGGPGGGPPAGRGRRLALASIVYDLIPHLFREQYLGEPARARDYDERLRVLTEYDALLAISRSTRDDLVRVVGLPANRVFTIGGASEPSRFAPGEVQTSTLAALGIRSPYVLSVAAATDERKNSRHLMEAVARVPGPPPPQLVLCHQLSADERAGQLRLAEKLGMAGRLVMTGRVDDDVLQNLYRGCAVFALPSRYEGFGLPLLEAMMCGAPVIGARNSSQPEVVGPGGHLVEPDDVSALAELLQRLAFDQEARSRSVTRGLLHAAAFRWDSCAARCEEALRRVVRTRRSRPGNPRPRLRVAFFSPLPPAPSGVADHAAERLERLQEVFDLDVFHSNRTRPHATERNPGVGVYDERIFGLLDRERPYDALLHEMGNSYHHDFVYRRVLRDGGLVVLHEINLAGLHADLAAEPGADPRYLEKEIAFDQPERQDELVRLLPEMAREAGGLGRALGVRGAYLARRLVQRVGRILVSDRLTLEKLGEAYPEARSRSEAVPLGAVASPRTSWEQAALRREHGLPEDAFVFGVFGIVSSTKYHLEILDAFRSIAEDDPRVLLLYVGRGPDGREVRERARQASLAGRVRFIEDPPNERFRDLVHVADVGVNVRRPPTNWESSASLLQLLAAGVPTITSAVDAFRGLPAGAVESLEGGLEPRAALEVAMKRLLRSAARRRELREGALRHVSSHHDWGPVVRACVEQLEQMVASGIGRRGGAGA